MRRMTIVAIATMLTTASAFGQSAGTAGPGAAPLAAKPVTAPSASATNPAPAPSRRREAGRRIYPRITFGRGFGAVA